MKLFLYVILFPLVVDYVITESPKDQLFAKNAPILSKEKVIELLKEVRDTLPITAEPNEFVQAEVDKLLEIGEGAENAEICSQRQEFLDRYPTSRSWFKSMTRLASSSNNIDEWNSNVANYIKGYMQRQFDLCAELFVNKSNQSLNDEQLKVVQSFVSKFDLNNCNNIDRDVTRKYFTEWIKAKLPPPKKGSIFGKPSKKRVEEKFFEEYSKLESACRKLEQDTFASSQVVTAGYYEQNVLHFKNTKLDEMYKNMSVCLSFNQLAHPQWSIHQKSLGKYIFDELIEEY